MLAPRSTLLVIIGVVKVDKSRVDKLGVKKLAVNPHYTVGIGHVYAQVMVPKNRISFNLCGLEEPL